MDARGTGRRVVLTIPSKQALAGVMHKIKQATKTGEPRALGQVLRKLNPILRGWAAYFRYGASKQTFSYLGWYAWWRMIYWIRRKHPHLTWKQIRRRFYGADRIREGTLVLYNPAKMRVERYATAERGSPRRSTSTSSTRPEPASVARATTTSSSSGRSPN